MGLRRTLVAVFAGRDDADPALVRAATERAELVFTDDASPPPDRLAGGRAAGFRAELGRAELGRAELVGRAELGRAELGRAGLGRAELDREAAELVLPALVRAPNPETKPPDFRISVRPAGLAPLPERLLRTGAVLDFAAGLTPLDSAVRGFAPIALRTGAPVVLRSTALCPPAPFDFVAGRA